MRELLNDDGIDYAKALELMKVPAERRTQEQIDVLGEILLPVARRRAAGFSSRFKSTSHVTELDFDECFDAALNKLRQIIVETNISPKTTAEGLRDLISTAMKRGFIDLEREFSGRDGQREAPSSGDKTLEHIPDPTVLTPAENVIAREDAAVTDANERFIAWVKQRLKGKQFGVFSDHMQSFDVGEVALPKPVRAQKLGMKPATYDVHLSQARKDIDRRGGRNVASRIFSRNFTPGEDNGGKSF